MDEDERMYELMDEQIGVHDMQKRVDLDGCVDG